MLELNGYISNYRMADGYTTDVCVPGYGVKGHPDEFYCNGAPSAAQVCASRGGVLDPTGVCNTDKCIAGFHKGLCGCDPDGYYPTQPQCLSNPNKHFDCGLGDCVCDDGFHKDASGNCVLIPDVPYPYNLITTKNILIAIGIVLVFKLLN